jgi:hypothetical protein
MSKHPVAGVFGLREKLEGRAADLDRALVLVERAPARHVAGAPVEAGTSGCLEADHEREAVTACAPYFHVLEGAVKLQRHIYGSFFASRLRREGSDRKNPRLDSFILISKLNLPIIKLNDGLQLGIELEWTPLGPGRTGQAAPETASASRQTSRDAGAVSLCPAAGDSCAAASGGLVGNAECSRLLNKSFY